MMLDSHHIDKHEDITDNRDMGIHEDFPKAGVRMIGDAR
jgi:hypothetical protein